MEGISHLPYNDCSSSNSLATVSLNTPVLGIGVPAVFYATLTFFMSHFFLELLMMKPLTESVRTLFGNQLQWSTSIQKSYDPNVS